MTSRLRCRNFTKTHPSHWLKVAGDLSKQKKIWWQVNIKGWQHNDTMIDPIQRPSVTIIYNNANMSHKHKSIYEKQPTTNHTYTYTTRTHCVIYDRSDSTKKAISLFPTYPPWRNQLGIGLKSLGIGLRVTLWWHGFEPCWWLTGGSHI